MKYTAIRYNLTALNISKKPGPRMAAKSSMKNPDSEALYCSLGDTVDILRRMGGIA